MRTAFPKQPGTVSVCDLERYRNIVYHVLHHTSPRMEGEKRSRENNTFNTLNRR